MTVPNTMEFDQEPKMKKQKIGMKIGFVGCGKLGLPVCIALDWKGHDVLGYDINVKPGSTVAENRKTKEAGPDGTGSLDELSAKSGVKFAGSLREVVEHSDIIFVAIQTPHNPLYEGVSRIPESRVDFDYTWLKQGVADLSRNVDECKSKQSVIMVIISTVLPTTLRRDIFPVLSRKIKLCYNPFFIAMGTVVRDFVDPEFILLGAVDDEAGETLIKMYKTITSAPVYKTSLENAELIKVSYNTFIGMKVAYANVIMELCDHLPNTNCDEVMGAIRLSHRRLISGAYLTGGMGDGGGCHPRDNIALSWLCRQHNLSFDFYDAIMSCREKQTEYLAKLCQQHMQQTKLPLMILGKAFKPETSLITGSPAILLRNILEERGVAVSMYDPYVDKGEVADLSKARVYFIGTKHEIFKTYDFPQGSTVIDPNRYIQEKEGVTVYHVGGQKKASGAFNDDWSL